MPLVKTHLTACCGGTTVSSSPITGYRVVKKYVEEYTVCNVADHEAMVWERTEICSVENIPHADPRVRPIRVPCDTHKVTTNA